MKIMQIKLAVAHCMRAAICYLKCGRMIFAAMARGETMTGRDLIKALRYCAGKGICDDCPVQNESIDERMCCDDYLNLLAAARLEELSCHRDSTI